MSIETTGVGTLKAQLLRLGGVPAVVNEELKKCAEELAVLARKMAPVDKTNLEKSIKVRYEGTQGAGGRFVKGGGSYAVFVDMKMSIPGRDGKVIGDYAWEMHEHLHPFGHYNLGDKSLQKQMANPNVMVGGKFLERATEELRDKIQQRLARVVFKYVQAMDKSS